MHLFKVDINKYTYRVHVVCEKILDLADGQITVSKNAVPAV